MRIKFVSGIVHQIAAGLFKPVRTLIEGQKRVTKWSAIRDCGVLSSEPRAKSQLSQAKGLFMSENVLLGFQRWTKSHSGFYCP
jgi:hypothetical protein